MCLANLSDTNSEPQLTEITQLFSGRTLRHHRDIARELSDTRTGNAETTVAWADAARALSRIRLLVRLMALSVIDDPEFEAMLTRLRRAMLTAVADGEGAAPGLPFAAALALQCFTNEYVFAETAAEVAAVERLERKIASAMAADGDVPVCWIAALAAYRPLHHASWAARLDGRSWPDEIAVVIVQQVAEPSAERSLRAQIDALTDIDDAVSQAVRAQYEENPYPRGVGAGLAGEARTVSDVLAGAPYRFDLGDQGLPARPEILVVGCGTGQQALRTVARFANSRVLAVDLSLNSLAYALRKTREAGVANVEFAQADLLELGGLGRQFDVIECAGVLHHLRDPLAGWRILAEALRPRGIMRIGLYSELARRHVVAARAMIADAGYTTAPDDIRRARQDIVGMATGGDAAMAAIAGTVDFFSLSECRDLLFHVQERRFELPQIEAALVELGLRFLGFELSNRTRVMQQFSENHPDAGAATSLVLWHQFELGNPDTFYGMYDFWVQRA